MIDILKEINPVLTSMHLSAGSLIAGLIFGIVGIIAFRNGRKKKLRRPQIIGVALMVYPSFVFGAIPVSVVGIILTAALYFWREKQPGVPRK